MVGNWDQMAHFFTPELLQATNLGGLSLQAYIEDTEILSAWTKQNLAAELIGNDIHPLVWRVRVYSEDGRGAGNPAGWVGDLALVQNEWKFVLWSDYKN